MNFFYKTRCEDFTSTQLTSQAQKSIGPHVGFRLNKDPGRGTEIRDRCGPLDRQAEAIGELRVRAEPRHKGTLRVRCGDRSRQWSRRSWTCKLRAGNRQRTEVSKGQQSWTLVSGAVPSSCYPKTKDGPKKIS